MDFLVTHTVFIRIAHSRIDTLIQNLEGKPHTKRELSLHELIAIIEGRNASGLAMDQGGLFLALEFEKETDAALFRVFSEDEETFTSSWLAEQTRLHIDQHVARNREVIREARKLEQTTKYRLKQWGWNFVLPMAVYFTAINLIPILVKAFSK